MNPESLNNTTAKPYTCVVLIRKDLFYKIRPYLGGHMNVIIKQQLSELVYTLRTQAVHCGILYCETPDPFDAKLLRQTIQKFPKIPMLAILQEKCIETAHAYGRVGIEKLLHFSDIDQLNEEVNQLIHQHNIKVTLKDIGIPQMFSKFKRRSADP